MTVPTQPVTLHLADFGGPSIAGVTVRIIPTKIDYTADGTFVSTKEIRAVSEADGLVTWESFPCALVANGGLGTTGSTIRVIATPPGSRQIDVQAATPNTPCNLVDYLVDQEPNGLGASERAASDAQAARDVAIEKAQAASDDSDLTALDRIATGQDRVQTGLDRIAPGQDRTQTGLDRVQTGVDRVQTGLDSATTQAARDAALAAARIFTSTALGLAGTTSGQFFYVPSTVANESLVLYLNSAGSAVEQKRYPSSQAVAALDAKFSTRQDWLFDSFTVGATTALTSHPSDTGHSWVYAAGSATSPNVFTTFGGVVGSGAAAVQVFRTAQIAPAASVKISAGFQVNNANYNNVGVAARLAADASSGYIAVFNKATSHWQIMRLGAGLTTTLLASSAFTVYVGQPLVPIEFSIANAGSSAVELTLAVSGLIVATVTDTDPAKVLTAGYGGLFFDTTTAGGGPAISSFGISGPQPAERPRVAFRAPYIDMADYDVDPTFTVDSTAGFQAAINDAFNRRIERIKGMRGRFKIAGALNGVTNSQLFIPHTGLGNANRSIILEGPSAPNFEQQGLWDVPPPTNGMILESTIAGSGTLPSVLAADPGGEFNLTNFGMTNIGVRTRVSGGANTMCALNFNRLAQLTMLDSVRLDIDMGLQTCPTPDAASCGLIMPGNDNHALLNVGTVYISGYYTGVRLREHSKIDSLIVVGAVAGIQLDTANHGSHIGLYLAENVAYPIWIAGQHALSITHYTTEHDAVISWATYVRDIHNSGAFTRKIAILRSSVVVSVGGYNEAAFSSNDATIYKIVVGAGAN